MKSKDVSLKSISLSFHRLRRDEVLIEPRLWSEAVSYMDRVIEADELKEYLDPNSKEVNGNEGGDRNKMYSYMVSSLFALYSTLTRNSF